jgi:3-hydroxyacyl-CoA dehydrogenase/enoyl-CoA hydratase/3-hydroxybutyryl-CoA epimerase
MNLHHLRIDDSNPKWTNLWVDVENRSLNVMSSEVFRELDDITQGLVNSNQNKPVVVRSAKARGNIVGADIKEILTVENDAQTQAFLKLGQDIYQAWENLPFPTIAWIRGACLGGGLEWALACQYRFACSDSDTVLGMPECKLGLLPGWGGTQRLPRWVGLIEGWNMLAHGESITSQRALEIGLVDGLWDSDREEDCLNSYVDRVLSHPGVRSKEIPASGDRLVQWKSIQSGMNSADPTQETITPMIHRSRETIAKAITVGLENGFSEGMRCERELFYGLLSQTDVQQGLQRFAPRRPPSSPS